LADCSNGHFYSNVTDLVPLKNLIDRTGIELESSCDRLITVTPPQSSPNVRPITSAEYARCVSSNSQFEPPLYDSLSVPFTAEPESDPRLREAFASTPFQRKVDAMSDADKKALYSSMCLSKAAFSGERVEGSFTFEQGYRHLTKDMPVPTSAASSHKKIPVFAPTLRGLARNDATREARKILDSPDFRQALASSQVDFIEPPSISLPGWPSGGFDLCSFTDLFYLDASKLFSPPAPLNNNSNIDNEVIVIDD
jgi:hypothetical protein